MKENLLNSPTDGPIANQSQVTPSVTGHNICNSLTGPDEIKSTVSRSASEDNLNRCKAGCNPRPKLNPPPPKGHYDNYPKSKK